MTTTFEDVNPFDEIEDVQELETQEEVQEEVQEEQEDQSEGDPLAIATYEALVERGLFEKDDNFNNSFDYIESKLSELPDNLLRQAVESKPEFSRKVLDYILVANDNLTEVEFQSFIKEFIKEQDQPDVSSADSARAFLEDHFTKQGIAAPAVQAQLDYLEDTSDIVKEAEKLLAQREKVTDKIIQEKQQENQQIADSQKAFYTEVHSALKEFNWSQKQQDAVIAAMNKSNDIIQATIKNPKAYVQMMDFLSKFNGKEFDLEDYRKQGESRATSKFKEKIQNSGFSSQSAKTEARQTKEKNDPNENPFLKFTEK